MSRKLLAFSMIVVLAKTSLAVDRIGTPAKPFAMNPKLVEQARQSAAAELVQPRELKSRRPEGLERLETPEEIAASIQTAMTALHSDNFKIQAHAERQLAYLGHHAVEALSLGSRSENRHVAVKCCRLLGGLGRDAIPPLLAQVTNPDNGVSQAALHALDHGGLGDPACIPGLIGVLNALDGTDPNRDRRLREDILTLLGEHRDSRVVELLEKYGDPLQAHGPAGYFISRALQPEGTWAGNMPFWPEDKLAVRQLCLNAGRLAGENFGPEEIRTILDQLSPLAPQIVTRDATTALIVLRDPSVVPDVIRAIRDCDMLIQKYQDEAATLPLGSTNYSYVTSITRPPLACVLGAFPTQEAFNFMLKDFHSPGYDIRTRAAEVCPRGKRWIVPLIVGQLDDSTFLAGERLIRYQGDEEEVVIDIPPGHEAYSHLKHVLDRLGMEGNDIRVKQDPRRPYRSDRKPPIGFKIHPEIERVKKWWSDHGDDFLAGKKVPNPHLITIEGQ